MLSQHLHCRAETNESNSLTPAFSPASLSGLSWCCMVAVQPRKLPLGNQTTDEALIRNSDMQHVIWGVRPDDRVDKLSLLSGQNLQSGNRIVSAAAMIASPSLKLICNYKSMRCSPAYSDNSTVQRFWKSWEKQSHDGYVSLGLQLLHFMSVDDKKISINSCIPGTTSM